MTRDADALRSVLEKATFFEQLAIKKREQPSSEGVPEPEGEAGTEAGAKAQPGGAAASSSGLVSSLTSRFLSLISSMQQQRTEQPPACSSSSSSSSRGALLSNQPSSSSGGGDGRLGGGEGDAPSPAALAHTGPEQAGLNQVEAAQQLAAELSRLVEALTRKEAEVAHLQGIVRELIEARNRTYTAKLELAARCDALQQEVVRAAKNSQLARASCKSSLGKAARASKEVMAAQDEAHRARQQAAALRERNCRLKVENEELRAQLAGLQAWVPGVGSASNSAVLQELSFRSNNTLY